MVTPILYNYTGIGSYMGLLTFYNGMTMGMFWTFTVLALFVIIFLVLSRFQLEDAILSSSFITSTYAMLLRAGNLVPDGIVAMFILITALLGVFKFLYSRRSM